NSVRVMQPQQVMLAVRFVEATRTSDRELGINWNVLAKNVHAATGAFISASPAGVPINLASGGTPFGVVLSSIIGKGIEIDNFIQALEEKGLVRLLAEPNLIALSGDTASFLAGGEFPVPIGVTNSTGGTNNNMITVAWKRFGVGLAFTPTVRES